MTIPFNKPYITGKELENTDFLREWPHPEEDGSSMPEGPKEEKGLPFNKGND